MAKKIDLPKAVISAIAEDILKMLRYDEEMNKYILPEGAIFSIDPMLARAAAERLGVTLS